VEDKKSKSSKKTVSFNINGKHKNMIPDSNVEEKGENENEEDEKEDEKKETEDEEIENGLNSPQANLISGINARNPDQFARDNRTLSLFHDTFEQKEYAAKYVSKPVFNNVFMEKLAYDADIGEIMGEIRRLFCVLHFLQQEYNIFETLPDYLYHQVRCLGKAAQLTSSIVIKKELEEHIKNVPSMYPFNHPKRKDAIIHTAHIQFLFRKFTQHGSRDNVNH
ncbi:hypothetical protein RFI_16873, partial [Reticulomyxa filosa]